MLHSHLIFRSLTHLVNASKRRFSQCPRANHIGIYRTLPSTKLQKPWLQALAEKNAGKAVPTESPSLPPPTPTPKRMSDSYHSVVLPLAQDQWLVDAYVNSSGRLRLGALFQDLDALAGAVAYKHAGPAPTIVTAAVDRITIMKPLEECHDLQLSGYVNYVGTSSMEIALEARRIDKATQTPVEGAEGLLLTCAFTMVARDPVSKKAMAVSPLLIESDEEKEIFRRGEEYKKAKKALAKLDLSTQTPNDEESDLVHQMWMEQAAYEDPQNAATRPRDTVYMSATTIQNTMIMQPQYRNRHSFMIFGGYLMKQTMELAFCCCSAFAHTRPTFVSLDPSTFQAPVPVGSILYLTATVSYTEPGTRGSRVQVMVESKVKDVKHGNVVEAGVFNYTFWVDKKLKVMPVTYSEFIKYIDARRRAKQIRAVQGWDEGTTKRFTE